MKKTVLVFAAIIMMAGFTTRVNAQSAATISGTTAGAVLIVPMAIYQDSPLHFGTINLLSGQAGTVELSTVAAARTFTGGVAASAISPSATNASYHVTGTMNETYALTLPSTITMTETVGNTSTLIISALKARFLGAGADAVTSILNGSGTDSFTVGGTLTVPAGQIGGIYTGSFPVTVEYN